MSVYAPCPQCGATVAERLRFTWWGGVLGPRLLTHVKCGSCGKLFNGKTGKDNTTNIVIYFVIVGLICLALVVVIFAVAGLLMFTAR